MQEAIRLVLSALGAALAARTFVQLTSTGMQEWAALVIAAVSGVLVPRIAQAVLLELPMRITLLRRLIDRRARFEGTWIEHMPTQPESPFAISKIEYDPELDSYTYGGEAFSADGEVRASWGSSRLNFDKGKREVWFISDGQFRDSGAETIKSFGTITFRSCIQGRPIFAHGFFIDLGMLLAKHHTTLELLTKERIHQLTGATRDPLKTPTDIRNLLSAFAREALTASAGKVSPAHP